MATDEIEISYPVFYPVRKFYWSPDRIWWAIIIVTCLPAALHLNAKFEEPFRLSCLALWLVYPFYRLIVRHSDYEVLKGYIKGEIRFNSEEIRFEGEVIPIESIKKLDFSFHVHEGADAYYDMRSLNGQLSRGVDNNLTIYFKDGKEQKIFFQRKKPDDFGAIKPLLIDYCKKGLISFIVLTSMICSSYKEVQELKAKYF